MGMTIENVLEILEKHKLHIPSNVFYELKADIVNFEEPTTKNDLGVDCISREDALMCLTGEFEDKQYEPSELVSIFSKRIKHLPSVTPQEPIAWIVGNDNVQIAVRNMPVDMMQKINAIIGNLQESTTKNNLAVDCIDRQATLDAIIKKLGIKNETYLLEAERAIYQQILAMPSVTSQKPRCKECKWWKDSDGEYRRGCGAESKCPINRREVFEGNGYCYMFEPQESEADYG